MKPALTGAFSLLLTALLSLAALTLTGETGGVADKGVVYCRVFFDYPVKGERSDPYRDFADCLNCPNPPHPNKPRNIHHTRVAGCMTEWTRAADLLSDASFREYFRHVFYGAAPLSPVSPNRRPRPPPFQS